MSENVTLVKRSLEDRCVRLIGLMTMAMHAAELISQDVTVRMVDREDMGIAVLTLKQMIREASETLLSIRKERKTR